MTNIMTNAEKKIDRIIADRGRGEEWFPIAEHVKPGEEVANGFDYSTAPDRGNSWSLFEVAKGSYHVKFWWVEE